MDGWMHGGSVYYYTQLTLIKILKMWLTGTSLLNYLSTSTNISIDKQF